MDKTSNRRERTHERAHESEITQICSHILRSLIYSYTHMHTYIYTYTHTQRDKGSDQCMQYVCCFNILHLLWFLQCFYLLFYSIPWALSGGIWWKHPSYICMLHGLILCKISDCGFLCVSMYCIKKFLWWRLSRALIYKYSRITF